MAMDLLAGTAQSLKMVKDTVSALTELKIDIESRAKIADALTKLGGAQDALFSLRESLMDLQADNDLLRQAIAKHDDWKQRIEPYKLKETLGGAVVYHGGGLDGTPERYVCPSCVNKREIHFLQPVPRAHASDKPYIFTCTGCDVQYPIKQKEKPQPIHYR